MSEIPNTSPNIPDAFKTCPRCGFAWPTLESFLKDPALTVIGYQVNFEALKLGFFLFNHACKATLAVQAEAFWDLHEGPIYRERATGGEQCPGHCLYDDVLSPCAAQCECAFVRDVLQAVRNWPK